MLTLPKPYRHSSSVSLGREPKVTVRPIAMALRIISSILQPASATIKGLGPVLPSSPSTSAIWMSKSNLLARATANRPLIAIDITNTEVRVLLSSDTTINNECVALSDRNL